ncbi:MULTISPECIES: six-hairpin glycosidase-like protein [Dyadobacter]|uniref:Six-hairpin glycosidase-like protein n=2 Tax=Dyadobacter TaxID=120831 RepID=A0A5R9KM48_9BACT|nr:MULTISPECIES: six-hairpin glycosidase-like protein [Dyadobacter]KAA6439746.1 six-hairpin glycosidase-like protein [Dyadobacter flavalbus]TLU97312.1 six-hairpin glycosidase-like protein [Dyadobacter sediminis]GGC15814.1 hypothetical protein GCM10011325_48280 [Dyadobacter sediminis]
MINSIRSIAIVFVAHILSPSGFAQSLPASDFWKIAADGGIVWNVSSEQRLAHGDNIEMSGSNVSGIIHYTINKKRQLTLKRDIIFPQLRTYDRTNGVSWQKYRAYLRQTYGSEIEPSIADGQKTIVFEEVDSIGIEGKLIIYHTPVNDIRLTRTLFPSMTERLFVEQWTLTNVGKNSKQLRTGNTTYKTTLDGYKGAYHIHVYSDAGGQIDLAANESYSFGLYFAAAIDNESAEGFNYKKAALERNEFLRSMRQNLVLETGNHVLDRLFYFSKIRAAESIFNSKMGLVHSPGGGNYYLGVWANDQVEYSGPFFPLLGYEKGIVAARNAYRKFLQNIPSASNPIPYSFEIEGDIQSSNKDRGDAAMIAYGTSLYLLRTGDREAAKELWPLVEWSLAYCHSKLNEHGVVRSQTDEMEGRIPTGDANLATSSLYYGGLKYGSVLAKELGYKSLSKQYEQHRRDLEKSIESHFGHHIEGLDTYRYYEGSERLRHWICLPLAMGINTRAEATATALLDKLWTENGILVELNPDKKGQDVFWDRGTLYMFRGLFKAGFLDKSLEKLVSFSQKRLLGDHVPYAVEAYPENDMRHLSAESALYCRIFLEGLLGLEQTGFCSFSITPQLSQHLPKLTLRNLHLGDLIVSIQLELTGDNKVITKIYKGEKLIVNTIGKNHNRVAFLLR